MPDGKAAMGWALSLALVPALVPWRSHYEVHPAISLVGGLMVFGALFAINSSLHSFTSSSAMPGLTGYRWMWASTTWPMPWAPARHPALRAGVPSFYGLEACLWISTLFILLAALISWVCPRHPVECWQQRGSLTLVFDGSVTLWSRHVSTMQGSRSACHRFLNAI